MTDVYIARPDGSDRQKLTNSNEDAHYGGPQFRPAPTVRLAGETRIQTAVDISRHSVAESDAVVLARHDLYPDALAAAPLAIKHDAPLLLTPTGYVHGAVAEEIRRLGATTAHLMGSDAALDDNVERDLRELGIDTIERYPGANRFDTARLAASQTPAQHVYLTLGHDLESASGWADAVSQQVADTLEDQGRDITRIADDNRYLTSTAAADAAVRAGMDPSWTWFATGRNWSDSLAAGPAVARSGGILLLIDGLAPAADSPAINWYAANGKTPERLPLLGGPHVLDASLNGIIAAAISGPIGGSTSSPGSPPQTDARVAPPLAASRARQVPAVRARPGPL